MQKPQACAESQTASQQGNPPRKATLPEPLDGRTSVRPATSILRSCFRRPVGLVVDGIPQDEADTFPSLHRTAAQFFSPLHRGAPQFESSLFWTAMKSWLAAVVDNWLGCGQVG